MDLDLAQRFDRLDQFISEGRLVRDAWRERDCVCLLLALAHEIGEGKVDDCPETVLPPWLWHLTHGLNKAGTAAAWPAMVRRYARVVRAGAKTLDVRGWRRVHARWLISVLATVPSPEGELVSALWIRVLAGEEPAAEAWDAAHTKVRAVGIAEAVKLAGPAVKGCGEGAWLFAGPATVAAGLAAEQWPRGSTAPRVAAAGLKAVPHVAWHLRAAKVWAAAGWVGNAVAGTGALVGMPCGLAMCSREVYGRELAPWADLVTLVAMVAWVAGWAAAKAAAAAHERAEAAQEQAGRAACDRMTTALLDIIEAEAAGWTASRAPAAAPKASSQVLIAKNGRPYIKTADGTAKFISAAEATKLGGPFGL